MATKKVNLIISLKDNVSGKLKIISKGFSSLGRGISGIAKRVINLKGAFVGLLGAGGVLAAFGATIKKAFDFETAKIQLKSLLGSIQAAQKRFKELKEFSAKTPFQLPGILKASRLLTVFSEGTLGGAKSLESIGDAAAVAGQDISDVAFWVGRAYSMLKGGKPFGEAAMRLQEMGILTAGGRDEIEKLTKSGADFELVWSRLQKELGRFKGGMQGLSKTGNGLISTLKDNWTIAVATFGATFMEVAKDKIITAIGIIKTAVEDGTITKWAESAKNGFDRVLAVINLIRDPSTREKALANLSELIKSSFLDAVTSAANLFLKFAPRIGDAIWRGTQAAAKSIGKDKLTKEQKAGLQAEQKQFREEFELSIFDPALGRRFKRRKKEIEAQNREARLSAGEAGFVGIGGTRTEVAKARLDAQFKAQATPADMGAGTRLVETPADREARAEAFRSSLRGRKKRTPEEINELLAGRGAGGMGTGLLGGQGIGDINEMLRQRQSAIRQPESTTDGATATLSSIDKKADVTNRILTERLGGIN